jgi:hypothetical protein
VPRARHGTRPLHEGIDGIDEVPDLAGDGLGDRAEVARAPARDGLAQAVERLQRPLHREDGAGIEVEDDEIELLHPRPGVGRHAVAHDVHRVAAAPEDRGQPFGEDLVSSTTRMRITKYSSNPTLTRSLRVVDIRILMHSRVMRFLLALGMLAFCCARALADVTFCPALSGAGDVRAVAVHSSLDEPLAHRMIDAFRRADPDLAARSPDLGRRYLELSMSAEGRTVMAQELRIASLNPDVAGENTSDAMQAALGSQLRPVPVSLGLMAHPDQVKRARPIERWNRAPSGRREAADLPSAR